MCLCLLVVSSWRYVSCQHDGQEADKKNSEVEEGMNKEDGEKREGRASSFKCDSHQKASATPY